MSLTLDDLAATSGTAAQDLALKSKELTQKQPVVQVPIAHTTERRAQRQLAYDETTKTVNEWDDTIDAERKTSSLNFGKREAEQTSTSQLASSFFADTPLERRVEQILQQASAHNETPSKRGRTTRSETTPTNEGRSSRRPAPYSSSPKEKPSTTPRSNRKPTRG